MRIQLQLAALVSLSVLFVAGCQSTGDAERWYTPKWKYENYHRVAVLPAKLKSPEYADVGDIITQDITQNVVESGLFQVITRENLKDTLDEQTWSQITDADPSTRIPPGRIKAVEVLIIPTVTMKELSADRSTASGGGGGYGHHSGGGGGGSIEFMVNSATVSASVQIVDTATGQVLASISPRPLKRNNGSAIVPPSMSPQSLAAEAAHKLGDSLSSGIVPMERPKTD